MPSVTPMSSSRSHLVETTPTQVTKSTSTRLPSNSIILINFSNTIFLTQDADNLCYDRSTPNGQFRLKERLTEALASGAKIINVNVFDLNLIPESNLKVEFLQGTCGVPLVGASVNLEAISA